MSEKLQGPTIPPVLPTIATPRVLTGQKALVTGANSGIGQAIAIALGRAGADVMVNYVAAMTRPPRRWRGDPQLRREGDRAQGRRVEGGRRHAMFARARAELGTVDILINNAGLQRDAPFDQMTLDQWQPGDRREPHRAVPLCARSGPGVQAARPRPGVSVAAGKIICISSVHEVIPWAGHVNYAASKGGVMLMMKSIAQEVAPTGSA